MLFLILHLQKLETNYIDIITTQHPLSPPNRDMNPAITLTAEFATSHIRLPTMAAVLETQWLFNAITLPPKFILSHTRSLTMPAILDTQWLFNAITLPAKLTLGHTRLLTMATALKTQWLFNIVISTLTPILQANITYDTFWLFGACCYVFVIYTMACEPETKRVNREDTTYEYITDLKRTMAEIKLTRADMHMQNIADALRAHLDFARTYQGLYHELELDLDVLDPHAAADSAYMVLKECLDDQFSHIATLLTMEKDRYRHFKRSYSRRIQDITLKSSENSEQYCNRIDRFQQINNDLVNRLD